MSEEHALQMGNEILRILGADQEIDDIETFQYDSLYLQLFGAFFPNLDLESVQPGETPEEMANNIQAMIDLLSEQVLECDLSYIEAEKIVEGDLQSIGKFLEVILEVLVHIAQANDEGGEGEGEGEEEGEDGERESPEQNPPPPMEKQEEPESPAQEEPDLLEGLGGEKEQQPEEKGKMGGSIPDFYGDDQPD